MTAIANPRKIDTLVLAALTTILSLASFAYFYSHEKILLYGDAVAHINIARRVFDSRFPGLSQLGTVWLPLPHLLMLPFIVNDWLWSSGVGGSLVSMAAYIVGAIGLAKVFWTSQLFSSDDGNGTRTAGWIAALIYLLNPNLLYLQSTAMTEPLGLALMIWAIYFYCRFVVEQRRALLESIAEENAALHEKAAAVAMFRCSLVLAAAMLTRYDYWFVASAIALALLFQLFARYRALDLVRYKVAALGKLRRRYISFVVVLAIVPAFWLAYNQYLFGNAMEFANGKYSARAIEARSLQQGNPPHPGAGDLTVAATYYWKTTRANVGETRSAAAVVIVGAVGLALLAFSEVTVGAVLVFPLLFYTFSIAHGGIPIFIPEWWPFSYYNVRYGIQLLPAFAVGCGYCVYFLRQTLESAAWRWSSVALLLAAIGTAYFSDWKSGPICLREAEINSAGRIALHKQIAAELKSLPPASTFVVSLTEHVGAFQRAGIPLRRTWNESSHRSGEQEFAFPLTRGDYVIAFDGDPVAHMVAEHPEMVTAMAAFSVPGEKRCVIYKATPLRP